MKLYRSNKLVKVMIWRAISILLGWLLAYVYLEDARESLQLSFVIGIAMTIVHYIFESQWEKLEDHD